MYAPTANGAAVGRRREQAQITASSPKVATASLANWPAPARTWVEGVNTASPNMRCATNTPKTPPAICATT
jgi:hypothetical protein